MKKGKDIMKPTMAKKGRRALAVLLAFCFMALPMTSGRGIFGPGAAAAQDYYPDYRLAPDQLDNLIAPGGRYRQESYCCISTLSGAHTYPSSWYAFNWGSARFYVLEAAWADTQGGYQGDFLAHWNGPVSGCAPCGAELQWLKADLAAHAGALKFAFFHYPLHSDSTGWGLVLSTQAIGGLAGTGTSGSATPWRSP